jgi:hypothetical protein
LGKFTASLLWRHGTIRHAIADGRISAEPISGITSQAWQSSRIGPIFAADIGSFGAGTLWICRTLSVS